MPGQPERLARVAGDAPGKVPPRAGAATGPLPPTGAPTAPPPGSPAEAAARARAATPLQLGRLTLTSRVMLAPMAGVCDGPFKRVVRRFDRASLLSTELVNGEAWLRGHHEMAHRMRLHPEETPVAIQLSGHDPAFLAEAAAKAEAEGADLVDLNFGCPAPHLVNSRNGAARLRFPDEAPAIFAAVRRAVLVPVTVKMRLGWDADELTGLAIARMAEACGLDAVWVHGRTKAQGYGGRADWEAIAGFKAALSIPVIGNGDILTPEDAWARFATSGVDAVAVGRGAMGNPWIFERAQHLMATGEALPEPTLLERVEACRLQCRLLVEEMGDRLGVPECRKHVSWYVRGLPAIAPLRDAANRARTLVELEAALDAYLEAQPDLAVTPRRELWGELVDPKWMRYRTLEV
ncbi:MAG: tRNA dihydrouridine synthase DusB [Candidatus Sericytochromatia bacterium]|nr:tRNA dihydrouridine synthase DusB [Candidatus Sericytochromatia bacterium]